MNSLLATVPSSVNDAKKYVYDQDTGTKADVRRQYVDEKAATVGSYVELEGRKC